MTVACTLVAAGASRRLDRPLRLIRIHETGALVRWAVQCACGSRCSPVSVTGGANFQAVSDAVGALPVEVIGGFDWREGSAACVRAATLWAIDRGATALLLCPYEQPLLTPRHLNTLWEASQAGSRLAASHYAGQPRLPAVFPEAYFSSLLTLRGDEDAGSLLRFARDVTLVYWWEGEANVDRPEELVGRAAW